MACFTSIGTGKIKATDMRENMLRALLKGLGVTIGKMDKPMRVIL
jgi:hypothetical protein